MKDVHIPTVEQLREAATKGFVASLGYKSISDHQFDLWIVTERNRVAELAISKERKRIIEAIKPFISKGYFPPEEVGDGDWLEIEYSELTALIEGD